MGLKYKLSCMAPSISKRDTVTNIIEWYHALIDAGDLYSCQLFSGRFAALVNVECVWMNSIAFTTIHPFLTVVFLIMESWVGCYSLCMGMCGRWLVTVRSFSECFSKMHLCTKRKTRLRSIYKMILSFI